MKEEVLNWINRHDKAVHFLACLTITLLLGMTAAIVAALTKEASDELAKRKHHSPYGWDWLDLTADAAGIAVGYLLIYFANQLF